MTFLMTVIHEMELGPIITTYNKFNIHDIHVARLKAPLFLFNDF